MPDFILDISPYVETGPDFSATETIGLGSLGKQAEFDRRKKKK